MNAQHPLLSMKLKTGAIIAAAGLFSLATGPFNWANPFDWVKVAAVVFGTLIALL